MHKINHLKLEKKNCVEVTDESRGGYPTDSDIKLKTTMIRSSLHDYADAYILVNGTITIIRAGHDAAARGADEINEGITVKNCPPCIKCISKTKDTEI